ncbi:threonine/serine exporter family protein [bacterium LRH843]|nr:threonine/serine exporter family protein [bacterium LRH843]
MIDRRKVNHDDHLFFKSGDTDPLVTVKACLLAGRIMMKSGAETYRVEDTMLRIAAVSGMNNSQCFVTPTGIIFSIEGLESTYFVRIHRRGTDLDKIAKVNSISRNLTDGRLTSEQSLLALEKIEKEHTVYPSWLQILAAAFISGSFLLMFQGHWSDYIYAMIVGGSGFSAFLLLHCLTKVKFFAEFIAAVVVGGAALLFVHYGYARDLDIIIIASVMPLVPGLLITNAIRDLMAGHFFSGLSKGAEAFLTAFAIGSGVAFVFGIFI